MDIANYINIVLIMFIQVVILFCINIFIMRKSETGSLLPYIKTQRSSLNNKQRMKSVFIERAKQEVSQETSYQVMDSSTIGEQQKKLKQLLRQFNDKSQMILADFISVPAKLTENVVVPKKPVEHLIKVREEQGNILAKMMQQCQTQLKLLQSRCENLKYTNRQEMIRQIHLTKTEIEKLRTENKDMGREVTLNGLNICRGDRYDLVKELESEKLQLQSKKQQNNTQNSQVLKQIESTIKKTAELEKETVKWQSQYRQAISVQHSLLTLQKMKEQAKQKKKLIEQMGTKNEQVNGAIKQRYLTKLRQLQQINNSSKKNSEELTTKQEAIQKTRKQLIILEHQLSALKSGVTTIKLLESQKKKN